MEIKRIIRALCAAAVILSAAITGYAADNVIYESGRTETANEAVDLDGWGEELFTRASFEADVRFKGENSGITLRNADNTKGGTSIRAVMRNDVLTMAAYGGVEGNYIYYNAVDTEKTYHITLVGTYGVANGMIDMRVDTLDENGNVEESKTSYLILMNEMYASSNVGPEHIRVEANTVVDNVKVTVLKPDSIEFVSAPQTVTALSATELKVKFYRGGEELEYDAPIEYTADGNGVSISQDGVLAVSEAAPEQEFTVTAKSGDMTATAKMQVVSGDIFTVNTALFDEDGTTLEAVNAVKNYFFNETAVFVVTVYDENGLLADCFVKNVNTKSIPVKTDTDIILGYKLPEKFDKDTWTIEINAWGGSEAADLELLLQRFPIREYFEGHGGAVEWIAEHRVIVGMLNGKTIAVQVGRANAFVDGEEIIFPIREHAVDISTEWISYGSEEIILAMR